MAKKKVLLGMSGGTDSSVTAMILKEKGYEVIGVSLWLWGSEDDSKLPDYILDAKQLANKLNIDHYTIDAKLAFKQTVIKHFIDEYLSGRTPSPCIHCNPNIKWKLLYEKAMELNCEFISTGHYINIQEENNIFYIYKGKDQAKDQSYFLWNLPQSILSKTITPLGQYTKPEVREIARKYGFEEVATKKESMGICFVDNMDYRDFLKQQISVTEKNIGEGNVFDEKGNYKGTHQGYPYYTIGQKRGMELLEKEGLMISKIDAKNNTLIIEPRLNLNKKNLHIKDYYFNDTNDSSKSEITTMVRGLGLNPSGYSTIKIIDEKNLEVSLESPAWAIAPGQPVAFYINDKLIGGGFVS